jgi:hypothetical protein
MRAAYGMLLSIEWRQENVRIRQKPAIEEYPLLAKTEREPRLLEDLWTQLWSLNPHLIDILATISQLKRMKSRQRTEIAIHLQLKFQKFYRDFTNFVNSPSVTEMLQPLHSPNSPSEKVLYCVVALSLLSSAAETFQWILK